MKALREQFYERGYECCQITAPYKFTIIIREKEEGDYEVCYADDVNHLELWFCRLEKEEKI